MGLDLAANAAAQCGVPLVSYCAKVTRADNTVTVEGQLYGGKLLAELDVPMPAILMVNPGSYREEDAGIFGGAILEASPPSALDALRTKVVKVNALDPNAVDITLAESLVCVGRGIGSKDNIDEVRSLVEKLGGELAGSRPVIDAGWLTKERQVGKSGRKVKPRLYLSLGVSGAPEHLEGMSASELIIAINTDAKAPIFDNAHFGATVDAMDFVESMIEQLK